MKKFHFSIAFLLILGVFGMVSCVEWDKMDPPAGNQVYRSLAGQYSFNKKFSGEAVLMTYPGGNNPSIAEDTVKGYVAELAGGYIQFENPLKGKTLKHGASVTMWMKTSGNSTGVMSGAVDNNVSAALFSFTDETESQKLFFTSNGWLNYSLVGTTQFEANNPGVNYTGMITPDEWHFLSFIVKRDGYKIYVDGEVKYEETVTEYEFSEIVASLTEVAYLYLGYGGPAQPNTLWIDDVKVYSDLVTYRDVQVPSLTPPSFDDNFIYKWLPLGTVGYYPLDGNFDNELNPAQSGEFISVIAQAAPSAFTEDAARGIVWNQQEGWAGDNPHGNGYAYTRIDNPLVGQTIAEGVSVSMWINPPFINWWDQIFCVYDGVSRFWINALGYVGYNGAGGWFDLQQANYENELPANDWTLVTMNVTLNNVEVLYNGEFKFDLNNNAGFNGDLVDATQILELFKNSDNFFLGYGSFWGAAPAMVDDIYIVTRPVSQFEAKLLHSDMPSLYGYYALDNTFDNEINSNQGGEQITNIAQVTPSAFTEDATRGIVWNQQEGWAGDNPHGNGYAYTRFDNPLVGQTISEGVSVNMWINPPFINWWDQIFCVYDGTSRFWINALGYVGYNGAGGWFDIQQANYTNELPANEWTLVTINVTTSGFEVFYNGEHKFGYNNNAGFNGDISDITQLIELFKTSDNFYLGYGSFWGAAPALVDDIYIWGETLTAEQITALYNATKK